MVSAQLGGDAKTAIDAARKLDASVPAEPVGQFPILQPIKASPYTTHAQFSDPMTILQLPAPRGPGEDHVPLCARRCVGRQGRPRGRAARDRAIGKIENGADFKPFEPWGLPAKELVQTAKLVATGRFADTSGDLDAAAQAYERAIAIEDGLAYTESPHWCCPVRQSLGSVRLRQGRLDAAAAAFRDSLRRVRNNGWALAGLAEVARKKGDAYGERAARQAYGKAWFGPPGGPDLARL